MSFIDQASGSKLYKLFFFLSKITWLNREKQSKGGREGRKEKDKRKEGRKKGRKEGRERGRNGGREKKN